MPPKPSPILRPSRRGLLAGGLATGAAAVMPRPARAISPADRKFIFVFACGGWDPTRVLADGFDHTIVDMEANATRASIGDVSWVDSPERPSVRAFFERYGAQSSMLHGLLVPSIAHEACFILSYTGASSDKGSDWPSILGAAGMSRYVAPTLVLGGPTFPGINLPAVVQTGGNGQLSGLMDDSFRSWSPSYGSVLSTDARAQLDAYVRARGESMAANAGSVLRREMAEHFSRGCVQAEGLRSRSSDFTFGNIADLEGAFAIATMALSVGVSRTVSVCSPVSGERQWDSHATNDSMQTYLWEDLYAALLVLFDQLETLPGESTEHLIDETTVIVFSEMGRTPWLNSQGGKDHWPYTSAMLVGSGIRGGLSVGAYDDVWYGKPIDFATGEVDEGGETLTCAALGATLLALGDVDYAEYTGDVGPIEALIA